jgi:hypothetical protein
VPSRRSQAVPLPSAPRHAARRTANERARLLAKTPVIWLASRHEAQRAWLWALTGGTSVVMVLGWVAGKGSLSAAIPIGCLALALHLMLAAWVASEAIHSLAEARDSGALELLLATPLTTEEIIEGYFGALKRLFYRPVMLLVFVEAALLCAQVAVMAMQGAFLPRLGFRTAVAALCLLIAVLDLFAAARFGLWKGINAKKASRAFIQTVLSVLILPAVLGCFCFPVIGVVKNLLFINYGRQQLRAHFRAIVTQGFASDDARERLPPLRRTPSSSPSVLK